MMSVCTKGYFVAVDGPNGAGKSTLIKAIKEALEHKGYETYITKEPTGTECGDFVRQYAEGHFGIGVACLVAADRYDHIQNEILPELNKGKIVITDRYVLSTLILQRMDGVDDTFLLNLNSQVLKPNLQIAVFANEEVLQKRLLERQNLTRFEKGKPSKEELFFMKKGILELKKQEVNVICINNNSDLKNNVDEIVSFIVNSRREV